ncbi:MAG: aminotransferase class V-fold PLP-dependent enzyme [Lachnospiraceae bacterium]|nr:aminotransferase class V-fold PLP-dependent enzyme [Lachnospiraceae bacterium]
MDLEQALTAYSQSDAYPFHMPGHKRTTKLGMQPYQIDITEIEGFDNLHHATGILNKLQQDWAAQYGCQRAYILVNGTTCGNEALIFAATKPGDEVIVARGSHRSIYHAMAMRGLQPHYLMPQISDEGWMEPPTPEEIEAAVIAHPTASTVIITSPTYEGLCADIRAIADLVHAAGMSLIVDAAHGAHFGMHPAFPQNPIHQGADGVVVSLHKTLPTFTQTACLLWQTASRIDPKRIQKYLGYFESSSPSYVLMASTAIALRYLQGQGREQMERYVARLEEFRAHMETLEHLTVACPPGESDPSKILIRGKSEAYSGEAIMEALRQEDHLELEMASLHYALGMTSLMDEEEGFWRLEKALRRLDLEISGMDKAIDIREVEAFYQTKREVVLPLAEAAEAETSMCKLSAAAGGVAGGYLNLYPPGVPIYAPGERLSQAGIDAMEKARAAGYQVEGITEEDTIEIITEA